MHLSKLPSGHHGDSRNDCTHRIDARYFSLFLQSTSSAVLTSMLTSTAQHHNGAKPQDRPRRTASLLVLNKRLVTCPLLQCHLHTITTFLPFQVF